MKDYGVSYPSETGGIMFRSRWKIKTQRDLSVLQLHTTLLTMKDEFLLKYWTETDLIQGEVYTNIPRDVQKLVHDTINVCMRDIFTVIKYKKEGKQIVYI